jgi:transcriptional regulator with XRE-family HTH domain
VRLGLSCRALRIRRALRQSDVSARARVPRGVIGHIENGQLDGVTLGDLDRIMATMGATLDVRVRWRGEQLDRLLDEAHAATVAAVVERLQGLGDVDRGFVRDLGRTGFDRRARLARSVPDRARRRSQICGPRSPITALRPRSQDAPRDQDRRGSWMAGPQCRSRRCRRRITNVARTRAPTRFGPDGRSSGPRCQAAGLVSIARWSRIRAHVLVQCVAQPH